jgi:hypothetical protein
MAARRRTTIAAVAAGLTLGACANQVVLTARDGGPGGTGTSSGSMGSHGALKIQLEGQQYVGQWVVSSEGGFAGFDGPKGQGRGKAFAADSFTKAKGVVTAGYAGNGDGHAIANAADGKVLRCNFRFNTVTSNASGLCERSDGRLYDLTMKQ